MEKILANIKAGIESGIKNAQEKMGVVQEGILRKGSGSVILDNGLWSASWGICNEIEKMYPGTNEFTVTITVVPAKLTSGAHTAPKPE